MKRLPKIVLFLLFGFAIGYLGVNVLKKHSQKKEAERRMQALPEAEFSLLNQQKINLSKFSFGVALLIIYFHPDCEHCHYEAQEIGQNAAAFKDCQIVMITSDDSVRRVENFCGTHHLWELENFEILLDKDNTFKKTFGKAVIPSVYIYDKDRKLKKRFLGETKPEAIINEIQE